MREFFAKGWGVFEPEPSVEDWKNYALQEARRALKDPELAHLYECENTWFVGLDALDNDDQGCIAGSMPLSGQAIEFAATLCGGQLPDLHRAQLSGVFDGYPKPRAGETEAAFRYRLNRDAAHVDGVLGLGVPKRRFVREPHAFILGIPLTHAAPTAAPLVVWEGSHLVMKDAFATAFSDATGPLTDVDVTEIYQAARRRVFETCKRVAVHGAPGSVYLVHRLALHGVAPWEKGAQADAEGRLIAYFRPPMRGGVQAWVEAD